MSTGYWAELRAGNICTRSDLVEIETPASPGPGHCMTMGTASTMTAIAEALGLTLPGASSIPAPDANHIRMAAACGRRAVEMVWEDLTPDKVLSRGSVDNAVTVSMSLGCSTNAVIHLIAIARRAGVGLTLDDLDAASREVPVIANVRPSGDKYLMEDFFYAGGLRGLMSRLRDKLDMDVLTVSGETLGTTLQGAEVFDDDVIRTVEDPVYHEGSLALLRGNLAPDGCVIKPSACDPRFLNHEGRVLVYDTYPEMKAAVDDENLDVTADDILVLRNAGPKGGPGMPEWGMLPIPTKLVKQGVRDMLRISDARMSGTSYGACILHVSPESHVGGPLALLRTGDRVRIDVPGRRIDIVIDDEELEARRAAWTPPPDKFARGFGWMFSQHIKQAHEGCDFDYLETQFGAPVGEPDIY